jgi:hypothetical protein
MSHTQLHNIHALYRIPVVHGGGGRTPSHNYAAIGRHVTDNEIVVRRVGEQAPETYIQHTFADM